MKNYLISGIFSHSLSSQGMSRYFSTITLPITKKTKEKNQQPMENNVFLSGPDSLTTEKKRKDSSFTIMVVLTRPLVIICSYSAPCTRFRPFQQGAMSTEEYLLPVVSD